ncbi:MAG: ATP-binding protein [Candidatus Sericytochromatia bacterium]
MHHDWPFELAKLKNQLGVTGEASGVLLDGSVLYKRLIGSIKEFAVFMLNADGEVISWNEGAQRIKQYRADEVLGKHYRMLYTPEDQRAGRPEKNLRDALQYGQTEDIGWRMKKDGSLFWADAVISTVYGDDGRVVGFSKVIRDLTEINKADQQSRALELAAGIDRLKDQFLSLVSHELRTPLTTLMGYVVLLDEEGVGAITEDQHQYMQHILKVTETLTKLVNDLIEMTTIRAGKLRLETDPMNFGEVVLGAVFAVQSRAQAKNLWLANHVPSTLPELVADAERVAQVLVNVLDNAIKFTPEGGRIDIRASVENGTMRCEVQDTGEGIAPEDIEKLFKEFSQADMSATRAHGGLGIGLSIAKTLVERHGGHIGVLSRKGRGSTFWFTLPMVAQVAEAIAPPKPRMRRLRR